MRELILTPRAFDDVRSARRWYDSQREGLGTAFEDSLEAAFERIRRMPQAGRAIEPPFRHIPLRRFPYEVFCEFDATRVVIVLVFHTSRDPAAASARLREH
ncbi:type II toxin-antitoxin system RelE/ParE family toxin [soil metagenome]